MSNRSKGILFMIISSFGFAMMSAFVKLSGDLPSFQKTVFRNLVSVVIAFSLVVKNKDSFIGKRENRKRLLMRSIFGTLGIWFNYYAIDRLVLSDANMLNKLSPFFVIIFSTLFLKEKMKPGQSKVVTISCILAFIGALFVIKPTFNVEVMPAIVGLLGGISAAAAYTCVRSLSGKESPNTIVFFFSAFSTILSLPMMIMSYKSMTIIQFMYLILAGVFASVGQFGITFAYKYAQAKEISIFDYSNIIFSAIISVIVFNVMPDGMSFAGYIIIFIASLYMFRFNKKLDKIEAADSNK